MSAWPNLETRSDALELMDDRSIVGPELDTALFELRVINILLGSVWPTLEGVVKLWWHGGRPRELTLLDIGAGSGDVNRLLLRWADLQGIRLHIFLADIHPQTCAMAATYYRGNPRVDVLAADLRRLPVRQVDIVTASFLLHHFATAELGTAVTAMQRVARLGVVINDLHRNIIAWAGIRLGTQLFSQNRMIRNDGPLSVLRGFRRSELLALKADPDLRELVCRWRPWFRYLITIPAAKMVRHA